MNITIVYYELFLKWGIVLIGAGKEGLAISTFI